MSKKNKVIIKAVYVLIQSLQKIVLEYDIDELGRFFKEFVISLGKGANGEEINGESEACKMAKELIENARISYNKSKEKGLKGANKRWHKDEDYSEPPQIESMSDTTPTFEDYQP